MMCVRALVQKLFRSAKPEKLENHHSFAPKTKMFLVVVVTASNSCSGYYCCLRYERNNDMGYCLDCRNWI